MLRIRNHRCCAALFVATRVSLWTTKAAAAADLKADGTECADDNECASACISLPCDALSFEDTGDCGGVCGELATVDYEPDEPPPPPECNLLFADCSNGGGCCDSKNNAKAECLCARLASLARLQARARARAC